MSTCDICGEESARWESYPECRDCGDIVCQEHWAQGTVEINEGRLSCICRRCANGDDRDEDDEEERDRELEQQLFMGDEPVEDVEFDMKAMPSGGQ